MLGDPSRAPARGGHQPRDSTNVRPTVPPKCVPIAAGYENHGLVAILATYVQMQ